MDQFLANTSLFGEGGGGEAGRGSLRYRLGLEKYIHTSRNITAVLIIEKYEDQG